MKKKLFANYNFDFDKNERKLLNSFCKQALKQIGNENQYYSEIKAFNSVLDKLNAEQGTIKLTKDEKTRISHQLKQNIDFLYKEMKKSWFLKKWFMKSLLNQYNILYDNHFKG